MHLRPMDADAMEVEVRDVEEESSPQPTEVVLEDLQDNQMEVLEEVELVPFQQEHSEIVVPPQTEWMMLLRPSKIASLFR